MQDDTLRRESGRKILRQDLDNGYLIAKHSIISRLLFHRTISEMWVCFIIYLDSILFFILPSRVLSPRIAPTPCVVLNRFVVKLEVSI